jgi:hypothetical protein
VSRRGLDNAAMLALRLAVLTVAVLACAWFVVSVGQTHDQTRATSLIDRPGTPSRSQTAEILRLLHGAGRLNPDRTIAVLRAQAQTRAGAQAAAVRTAAAVVRAEPRNIDAWVVLRFAARDVNPAESRLAAAMERRLAPPVPAAP